MIKLNGFVPNNGQFVLAAADAKYVLKYASALTISFNTQNLSNSVGIHISLIAHRDDPDLYSAMSLLMDLNYYCMDLTWSWAEVADDNYGGAAGYPMGNYPKGLLQAARFFIAADAVSYYQNTDILCIDIDSIAMGEVEFPKCNVGLFLREHNPEYAMKVAAGCTLFSSKYPKFPNTFRGVFARFAKENPGHWSFDQPALYKTHEIIMNQGDEEYVNNLFTFNETHMNWDFNRKDTWFWTGKGDRKFNNSTYTNEVKKWSTT